MDDVCTRMLLEGQHAVFAPSRPAMDLKRSRLRGLPGISLRTVYQTLTDLASMGELRLIDVGAGAVRFDPNVDEHHHVICQGCGDVRDVYVAGSQALHIEGLDGFSVDSTSILFHGSCASCA